MKKYVILGATGHTGKPVALGLLEKGHEVRIVNRDVSKAEDLIKKGAKHVGTSVTDGADLAKAFQGADAAYVMIPPAVQAPDAAAYQADVVTALVAGLKNSGIKHVVSLSSVGAHLQSGAGIVQGLQKMEAQLNGLNGIHFLHLRPAYFFENTLPQAGMVKMMGIMGSPITTTLKFPMVASKDIGAVALRHLLALDFSGHGHEYILGSRDYTYPEIAKIYGGVIGKPDLNYVQFPYDDAKKAMVQMGLGASYVDELLEFTKAANSGKVSEDYKRTAANTTPTSAEEFAKSFKMAYDNG